MKSRTVLSAIAPMALVSAVYAVDRAESFQPTKNHNLVSLNNMIVSSGSVTSRNGVYAGNDLTAGPVAGSNLSLGGSLKATDQSLAVGGKLKISEGDVNVLGGKAAVGGSVEDTGAGSLNLHAPGALTTGSNPYNSTSIGSYYNSMSEEMSLLTNTGNLTNNAGTLRLTMKPGLNVVRTTATVMNNAFGLLLTGTATSSLVVNVQGTSVSSFSELNVTLAGGILPGSVVINYFQATDIRLTGGFKANFLAPKATVTFAGGGTIYGNSVVKNSIIENGFNFSDNYYENSQGRFYVPSNVPFGQPVPEPGTCAALGLGGLALLRRRKR